MAEMAETGHYHCHAVFLTVLHRVGVADGAAGLDDVVDALAVSYLDAVGEGEESVRCHSGAFEVEVEGVGFLDGVAEGVDARCLSYTRCEELTVAGKDDGVALAVLDKLVGEEHVGYLLLAEAVAGDELEVFGSLVFGVGILN